MPASTRDLSSTVVAITGASSGIGSATARALVEAGAMVAVGARRVDRLKELAGELGEDRVFAAPLDVRDPDRQRAFVAEVVERFGRLDSVVANAGLGRYGGILDGGDEEMRTMLDTNLDGTVWTVRAAVEQFRRAGAGGDVVVVASVAGLRGGGNEAVYAATKFGQVGLAGSLDREVRAEGIRVSTICPAGVKTEFALGGGRDEGDPALEDFLQPEDVAAAIVTVLSQPRRVRTTLWAMYSMAEAS